MLMQTREILIYQYIADVTKCNKNVTKHILLETRGNKDKKKNKKENVAFATEKEKSWGIIRA